MFGIEINPDDGQKKVEFEDTGVASMVDLSWLHDTSKDFKLDYHFRPNDMRNELGAKVLGRRPRDPQNVNDSALEGLWGSDPEPAEDRIKDVIVEYTRKLIAQGYSGNEVARELSVRFPVYEIKACAEQLTPFFKWDGIAGHFAVDPAVYEDCAASLAHAKKSRFASHLKYVIPCSKCASCSHRKHKCVKNANVGGSIDAALNPQDVSSKEGGCYCEKLGMPFIGSWDGNEDGTADDKYNDSIELQGKKALNDPEVQEKQKAFREAHKKFHCYAKKGEKEDNDYFYSIKPMALDGQVALNENALIVDNSKRPTLNGEVVADLKKKEVDMTPGDIPGFENKLDFKVSVNRAPNEELKTYKVTLAEPEQTFMVENDKKKEELKITFV